MSTNIDDGGPAFACADEGNHQRGMSLRDWFAGQALAAYGLEYQERMGAEDIASQCYSLADAMIAARKATQPVTGACDGLRFDDAVRIARGCLDYGGGYRGDTAKMEIFHHGIETVINSLESAQKRGLQDTQVAALHAMGKEGTP